MCTYDIYIYALRKCRRQDMMANTISEMPSPQQRTYVNICEYIQSINVQTGNVFKQLVNIERHCLSVCLPVYLSVCLLACLSVCRPVCLLFVCRCASAHLSGPGRPFASERGEKLLRPLLLRGDPLEVRFGIPQTQTNRHTVSQIYTRTKA